MANCPRCNACLPCGARLIEASDGTQGCTVCIPAYQNQLNVIAQQQSQDILRQLQQSQQSNLINRPG